VPAKRNRKHILVSASPSIEAYRPHPRKIPPQTAPSPGNRPAHGAELARLLNHAEVEGGRRRTNAAIQVTGAKPGLYVEFESQPGIGLKLETLESKRMGIELVSVVEIPSIDTSSSPGQKATVFVPDGKLSYFASRFDKYANQAPKAPREQRHEDMVDRIGTLRLATLEALWTDATASYPAIDAAIWWEIWLRRHDGREYERLGEFAALQNISLGEKRLGFEDRIVVLAFGTARQLSSSLDVLNDLAEVRMAKITAAPFDGIPPVDQAEWSIELLARTSFGSDAAPAVCILDTGVNRGHPLLAPALDVADVHAVDPAWGVSANPGNDGGHGTQMAGLALYGDLSSTLASTAQIELRHQNAIAAKMGYVTRSWCPLRLRPATSTFGRPSLPKLECL